MCPSAPRPGRRPVPHHSTGPAGYQDRESAGARGGGNGRGPRGGAPRGASRGERRAERPGRDETLRTLDEPGVDAFVAELFAPGRTLPVVGVTTAPSTGEPWLDAPALARRLEGHARVVVVPTGDVTWTLSEALPDRLGVYGGAVRIWHPDLTRDAEPEAHPLLFAQSRDEGQRVWRRVVGIVLPDRPGHREEQAALRARRREEAEAPARPHFSRAAQLEAWRRVAEEYREGDVVLGRVESLRHDGALVELLPGARGILFNNEMDYGFVSDPATVVQVDQVVSVRILTLRPEESRALLSMKAAHGESPRPPVALRPGEAPFLGDDGLSDAVPGEEVEEPEDPEVARIAQLEAEVQTLREERSAALERNRALKKELRAAGERAERLERQLEEEDPLSSEAAFLLAVRLHHARRPGESDLPLQRMRVGREFMDRLRRLEGVSLDKVIEVCALVACDMATVLASREVHPLREREGGSDQRQRAADGAKAWRCSIQEKTASARRLHWWRIPGEDGATIEFASVGIHDDFAMPE